MNGIPYPRPNAGSPLRVPLVPAFVECVAGERTTSTVARCPRPGLALNPYLTSTAKLGNSTQAFARLGHVRVIVCVSTSTPGCGTIGTAPDLRLLGNGSDIVCAAGAGAAACPGGVGSDYDPDPAAGPYTTGLAPGTNSNSTPPTPICNSSAPNPPGCVEGADMTAIAVLPGCSESCVESGIRVTDSFNATQSGADPSNCGSTTSCSATVVDQSFPVPVVCKANTDSTIGSYCGANTTANALLPGVVVGGKAAIVEIGQIVVYDSGFDGIREVGPLTDDVPFAVQGIDGPVIGPRPDLRRWLVDRCSVRRQRRRARSAQGASRGRPIGHYSDFRSSESVEGSVEYRSRMRPEGA